VSAAAGVDALRSWPFWAPSDQRAAERAIDLAGLEAGERFIDLGCGDGRVLVAAARRGAAVVGVESDADLVAEARANLAAAGVEGDVVEGDLFDVDLDADVLFTYLAPATLQRLAPRLASARPGARLVTVDFAVPGVEADRVVRGRHLYRLPLRPTHAAEPGWPSAGVLVVASPEHESLTTLEIVHSGGAVMLEPTKSLLAAGSFLTGADRAGPGEAVAVDVRWDGLDDGRVVTGSIRAGEAGALRVFVLWSEGEEGLWELTADACRNLSAHLRANRHPAGVDELLEAAEA
jgi:SAM-dependent methyltransferase